MTRANEALTRRISAWFLANPDEWLSIDDVAAKFGVPREYARWSLSRATADGRVQRYSVYGAAPQKPVAGNQEGQ